MGKRRRGGEEKEGGGLHESGQLGGARDRGEAGAGQRGAGPPLAEGAAEVYHGGRRQRGGPGEAGGKGEAAARGGSIESSGQWPLHTTGRDLPSSVTYSTQPTGGTGTRGCAP